MSESFNESLDEVRELNRALDRLAEHERIVKRKSEMSDKVNRPPHYTSHPSGIEAIEVTRHMNFNMGNAIKYIWRADLKGDGITDLKKAMYYMDDEISRRGGKLSHHIKRADLKKIIEELRESPDDSRGADFLYISDLLDYVEEL